MPSININKNHIAYSLLLIGSLVFLIYKSGFVFYSINSRTQPVEVDDAYVYMWKAVVMKNCVNGDCPAMMDIQRLIVSQATDKNANYRRLWKTERIVFGNWHPLHSAVLNLIYGFNVDWITAYRLLVLLSSLLICLSIIFWQVSVWGRSAAGLSLLYIAPLLFKGHGLNIIVPSNMALALGLFSWAHINHFRERTLFVLPLCVLFAPLMHSIGNVYAVISIILYYFIVRDGMCMRHRVSMSLSMIILVLVFLYGKSISTASLLDYSMLNTNWIDAIWLNVKTIYGASFNRKFFVNILSELIAVVAFIIVVRHTSGCQRKVIVINGTLVTLLCISSIFFVSTPRHYPAILYDRVSIIGATFFSGACAMVLHKTVINLISWLKKKERFIKNEKNVFLSFIKGSRLKILTSIISVLFLCAMLYQFKTGTKNIWHHLQGSLQRHSFQLDDEHVNDFMKRAEKGDSILYMDAIPMLFYLINGACHFGAIYNPIIANPSIDSDWLNKFTYIVGWNKPFQAIAMEKEQQYSNLALNEIKSVSYTAKEKADLGELEILIRNHDKAFSIRFEYNSDQSEVENHRHLDVPAKFKGWLSIGKDLKGNLSDTFRFIIETTSYSADLSGLRFHNHNENVLWPWRQKAILSAVYNDARKMTAAFNLHEVLNIDNLPFQNSGKLDQLQVIQDSGSLLLVKRYQNPK